VNCCADVRNVLNQGHDGGACPPVGPCRGFEGNCGDLTKQFDNVPVLPLYPAGLKDYVCTQWPNDDNPVDSFVVGLISIAVAIPVTIFMTSCFAIANDSEAPESWLAWANPIVKVFAGFNAHRRWHYTRGAQPARLVRWYVRSKDAPYPERFMIFCRTVKAGLTCSEPPWYAEADEAEAEAAEAKKSAAAAAAAPGGDEPAGAGAEAAAAEVVPQKAVTSSSVRRARALGAYKRNVMGLGLVGAFICWAVFTWCV
jgi:hypothetical protein